MKTIHTVEAMSLAAPKTATKKKGTLRWMFAAALVIMQSQTVLGQANIDGSPLTLNGLGIGDTWLQASFNGYHQLIGYYPGWDPGAVYLAGYNATNRGGEAINKVVVGGYGSSLPLVVTGSITGQSLLLNNNGNNTLNVYGNWGGGAGAPVARIVATDVGVSESGVEFNRKRGALNFELLNVHYQGASRFLVDSEGNVEARRDQSGRTQTFTITNRGTSSGGTGTALAFRGYRDVDANYETGRIAMQHIGGTAGDAAQFANMLFYVRGNNDPSIPQERMRILSNGNVLIGKSSQSNAVYLLDVNGSVRANEVVVNTTGADFVFDEGYKLMPLSEVESFIKANNHLPEMASAKEMQEEGAGVGEMQTKLLQKVEELTLHLIEQGKTLEAQNKRLLELEQENQVLKQKK